MALKPIKQQLWRSSQSNNSSIAVAVTPDLSMVLKPLQAALVSDLRHWHAHRPSTKTSAPLP